MATMRVVWVDDEEGDGAAAMAVLVELELAGWRIGWSTDCLVDDVASGS